MSLYFDAVSILTSPSLAGGSFKSRIYSSRDLKANPAQIYALITEASKWDILLKEVIENAGILNLEPKLSPLLALLLVHDHLLSKNGIAAPANHALRRAVDKHKSRLKAEFVKARVRHGCASVEELKAVVLKQKTKTGLDSPTASSAVYPRWVRINNIRSSLHAQLASTFSSYRHVRSLSELAGEEPRLYVDPNITDLLAITPGVDLTACLAYKNGEIILQDKASCFPAYLLGDTWEGDLVDACAAPGNKTTHLASLLSRQATPNFRHEKSGRPRIFSMDASPARSKTLQKMVTAAGADDIVTILAGQDFLALDPDGARFANVSGLLLDPSCSGSGIIGRDDVPQLTLPATSKPGKSQQGKKRKRRNYDDGEESVPPASSSTEENEISDSNIDIARLSKLSNIQTRIVEHALHFPNATRVTYSTCSVHTIENESVVSRVLASDVAKRRGWRVMRRDEQPEGLKVWRHRGVLEDSGKMSSTDSSPGGVAPVNLSAEELDACLRCWPGDEEGLGGFFVAGFVRDSYGDDDTKEDSEDEWEGFSD
ncbi:hypothetical protein PHISP_00189 [Aspergillus sp. HF37]|nr:hypothetical protein PHISP_00189 [Aspergillus sp. HF37]